MELRGFQGDASQTAKELEDKPIKLNSFEAEKAGGCEVVGRSFSFLFFNRISRILLVLGRVLSGHNQK